MPFELILPILSFFFLFQHFKLLLASTDPEVLVATLETLSALVKIHPSNSGIFKLIGCGSLNSYLLHLAEGRGSEKAGATRFSCVVANERRQEEGPINDQETSQCHFVYSSKSNEEISGNASSAIRLLAFIVLAQSSDANDELTSLFVDEPETLHDLRRVCLEETAAPIIRTLAVRALAAAYSASHVRAQINLDRSSINSAAEYLMNLLNDVLQKAVDPSSLAFAEALLHFCLCHVISSSASGTYAPTESISSLSATLSFIFGNAGKFGGDIYRSAVGLMIEMIQRDPTCLPELVELGLPGAFLSSVVGGVPPSWKAIACIPHGVRAICANQEGIEAVEETSALRFLLRIFTDKNYVRATSEAVICLADALSKIIKEAYAPSKIINQVLELEAIFLEIMNETIDIIAVFYKSFSAARVGFSTSVGMDSEYKGNEETCCLLGRDDEQFIFLCISNLVFFLERILENLLTPFSTSKQSGLDPPVSTGRQNILPYIEIFSGVCEKFPDPKSSYPVFVTFCLKHSKVLNQLIRKNPELLEKSFSLMLRVPHLVDFDLRCTHFRSKIGGVHHRFRLKVRRAHIFKDSFEQVMKVRRKRPPQFLRKGRLTVHFRNEIGIDGGGGLTREWYLLLSRGIVNFKYLFTTLGKDQTFQPDPNSDYYEEHLSYFNFVGRVVARALCDGQHMDVHFTKPFHKHILGERVHYSDFQEDDPDYYQSLKWTTENDVSGLTINFAIDVVKLIEEETEDKEGNQPTPKLKPVKQELIRKEKNQPTHKLKPVEHDLIPNGRHIEVTEKNKNQYVRLRADHHSTTAIRPQIDAFLEGFYGLIPRELISIFNAEELELLINGVSEIDVDDMRAHTEYAGDCTSTSPIIRWFWEAVQGFTHEDKVRLLKFVTGTSKVPLGGFRELNGGKFKIHVLSRENQRLPSSITCRNMLVLQHCTSKERLEERLLLVIREANEGFECA